MSQNVVSFRLLISVLNLKQEKKNKNDKKEYVKEDM